MTGLHQNAAVPLVAWQHHQVLVELDGLGCNGDVGFSGGHHFGNLRRAALAQRKSHFGIALGEALDDLGKRIAGLCMRGRNGEAPFVLFGELLADLLEVLDILQYPLRDLQDRLSGFGHGDDALAVADENIDAEFFLQAADLFADTGLRSMQNLRRVREIEILAGNFADVA